MNTLTNTTTIMDLPMVTGITALIIMRRGQRNMRGLKDMKVWSGAGKTASRENMKAGENMKSTGESADSGSGIYRLRGRPIVTCVPWPGLLLT